MIENRPTTPDDLYEIILSMHEGLSEAESELANAKLIIVLTDYIKDKSVICQAVKTVRENTLNHRKG